VIVELESAFKPKDAEGFSGAVGAKGISSLFGLKETPIAGTAAAGYVNRFNQLVGQLTLENMGVMKGVLSDADIKIIKEASTALNRSGREEDFVTEIGKQWIQLVRVFIKWFILKNLIDCIT